MAYLTEDRLDSVLDIPVSLPATDVVQGDWLIVTTVKVVAPMTLTYRWCNLQLISSSVDVAQIANINRVYGNLGLAYLALRLNYTAGNPGASGALDALVVTGIGVAVRDQDNPLVLTTPGTYSLVLANNMKPDSTSTIPASTSIDFRLLVSGMIRLDLSDA